MTNRNHIDCCDWSPDDASRDPAVGRIDSVFEYHGAIAEALGRIAARAGTVQAERLGALIAAVEEYEARNGHDIAEDDKLSVSIGRVRSTRGIE
jgi:ApbE superfamily uncharacterized protein (UPF0280 family)